MIELFTKTDAEALKQELRTSIANLGMRLTVRLGAMLAAGIAVLAVIQKPS